MGLGGETGIVNKINPNGDTPRRKTRETTRADNGNVHCSAYDGAPVSVYSIEASARRRAKTPRHEYNFTDGRTIVRNL